MHRIVANVTTGEVTQVPLTVEEETARDIKITEDISNAPSAARSTHNAALLAQIVPLQQKALRALIEDAPDVTFLNVRKAEIAALRVQWLK